MKNITQELKKLISRRSAMPRWSLFPLSVGIAFFGCAPSMGDKDPVTSSNTPPAAQAPQQENAQQSDAVGLRDLSVREEAGQTILLVKLSKAISQYRHFPLSQPSRIMVDVFNNARPAEPATHRVGTTLVSHVKLSSGDGYSRITLDLMAGAVPPYIVSAEDGGIKLTIGNADPKLLAKRSFDIVKDGRVVDQRATQMASAAVAAEAGGGTPRGEKNYTGQKISLDFKDADIKNVFRLLAEVSGLNIVVTNDVNRKVTLRLVDVPWDQALDLLIDTNGLGKEQIGNVVRISTAAQLKTERDTLAAARKAEETLEPLHTVYFNVNYAKVKDIEPKVKTLLSKRPDVSLVSDERSNTIMIRDIKKAIDDASALITKLDTRTPQILIESNLIETTPSFSRSLGSEIDLVSGRFLSSARFLAGNPYSGSPNSVSPPFPVPASGFKFGFLAANMNAFLTAAENEGNIKIISRPSVMTLNNVASTIRSERILRISLPSSTNIATGTGSSAAGAAVATEKIPVGINLTVTPQVSSDGFVLLNINVKSSSIANSPTVGGGTSGVIPFDELNREAVANVLVKDGETIVIGGILKDTRQEAESGTPFFKEIPILGWLFKNHRWQKDFEELMVFITPRIADAGSTNLPTAEQLWRDQMRRTDGAELTPPPAKL
jgi:type IV pilus assembly protein PilQ